MNSLRHRMPLDTPEPTSTHVRPDAPRRSTRLVSLLATLGIVLVVSPFLYRRVVLASETSERLLKGQNALEKGQIAEAESEWLEALRIAPNNPTALHALGRFYFVQRRPQEARKMFLRLAEACPSEPHVLCELTEAELSYKRENLSQEALEDGERATLAEPTCFAAQMATGEAHLRKGDRKRGAGYLKAASQLKPTDIPLRLHLINTLLADKSLNDAIIMTEELTQRYPAFAYGFALLGTLYGLLPSGDSKALQSEKLLHRALELDPFNGLAYMRLGRQKLQAKRPQEAAQYLEAAYLLTHGQTTSLLLDLSLALQQMGKTFEAQRIQQEYVRRSALERELEGLERRMEREPQNEDLPKRVRKIYAILGIKGPILTFSMPNLSAFEQERVAP